MSPHRHPVPSLPTSYLGRPASVWRAALDRTGRARSNRGARS